MQVSSIRLGLLSDYFDTVAFKTLSKVDTINGSNQHEFNGISALKEMFGSAKFSSIATFIYLGEDESQTVIQDACLTWYDAREKSSAKTGRSEYRLYYETNDATSNMKENDFLAIAKKNDHLHVIIAQQNTTAENQIMWLFGVERVASSNKFQIKNIDKDNRHINIASCLILDFLGIEVIGVDENYLEIMQAKFGNQMPTTQELSTFAQTCLIKEIDIVDAPDDAIVKLFAKEEMLYKTLERVKIIERLRSGFGNADNIDVDNFLHFSLSIQNARKSRAGKALEHHLGFIFRGNNIKFTNGGITENKSKPDFIFPSIENYHDSSFANSKLSMLASKSTCKDRWRQVLSEAQKISNKHLLTLEPSISENQTNEMKAHNLTLVLPDEIKKTYTKAQQRETINLSEFINIVRLRQIA